MTCLKHFGLGLAASAGLALAQPQPHPVPMPQPAMGATFNFIAADGMMAGKTVTGAPYSAEGVSDHVQTLGDGTRISRRSINKVARDSQGRTRDERSMPAIGPWAASGEAPKIVTIHDPVAKEMIILNERDKTAIRHKMPTGATAGRAVVGARHLEDFTVAVPPPAANAGSGPVAIAAERVMVFHRSDSGGGKEEPLGKQTFEGLSCEGKRVSHTIPAGEIGNDRALTTTIERWTSTDLQVLVRSTTKDPMSGETTFRLSSISRAEPAKSLFTIPPDYTIRDEKPFDIKIREVRQQMKDQIKHEIREKVVEEIKDGVRVK